MHLLVLDLDGSLCAQSSLHDAAPWDSVRTIGATDIAPRLRLWARARAIDEMRRRLDGIAHGEHAPSVAPAAADEVSTVAPGATPVATGTKRAVVR